MHGSSSAKAGEDFTLGAFKIVFCTWFSCKRLWYIPACTEGWPTLHLFHINLKNNMK